MQSTVATSILDRMGGIFEDREDNALLVEWNGELVPYFNQGDDAWSERTLGESATIGAAGCAITSIAMILAYHGRDMDPGLLDAHLDEHGGYLGDLVRWQIAFDAGEDEAGPDLDYLQHMSVDDDGRDALDDVIDERLDAGLPTIAHVVYDGGNHYVVIIGKNADGAYVINDPGVRAGAGSLDPSAPEALLDDNPRGYELARLVLHAVVDD